MDITLICLFITILLPTLPRVFVAKAQNRLEGGYDNQNPREQQKKIDEAGQRALAAHLNSFEALQMFSAAVLIAYLGKGNIKVVDALSIVFVISRLIYIFAYIKNIPNFRSAVWGIGFLATIAIGLSPLFA
jgi:uncharacterized MAPEG superfamily protein